MAIEEVRQAPVYMAGIMLTVKTGVQHRDTR